MSRVLIVDDEKSIRLTLSLFLRQEGYEVDVAEDADVALRLLAEKSFDVIVSDIILPRTSGVELLKKIHAVAPEVPVIMMTGEPTFETAVEAVRSGAYEYLSKPVSKDVIRRGVANAARVKSLVDDKKRLEALNKEYQEKLEVLVNARTDALRRSEEKYRKLFENALEGMFQTDPRGRSWTINRTFAQTFGFESAEALVLRDWRDLCRLAADPNDVRRMVRKLATSGGLKAHELKCKRRDNSPFWLTIDATAVRSESGVVESYEGRIEDVTERRRAAAELLKTRRDADEFVARLSSELRSLGTAVTRLATAMQAAISHSDAEQQQRLEPAIEHITEARCVTEGLLKLVMHRNHS